VVAVVLTGRGQVDYRVVDLIVQRIQQSMAICYAGSAAEGSDAEAAPAPPVPSHGMPHHVWVGVVSMRSDDGNNFFPLL
jgi:hypothetical protein